MILTVTHCLIVIKVFWLSKRFLSRASGPSASTARHLWKTSQYPWKSLQGDPGLNFKPEIFLIAIISEVLRQVSIWLKFWQATSHISSGLEPFLAVKKHSSRSYFWHIDPTHSPRQQTCVPPLHSVLFGLGSGLGQLALRPLQNDSKLHSDSCRHCLVYVSNSHVSVQHGPSDGEHLYDGLRWHAF
jgi:hypothetical protein